MSSGFIRYKMWAAGCLSAKPMAKQVESSNTYVSYKSFQSRCATYWIRYKVLKATRATEIARSVRCYSRRLTPKSGIEIAKRLPKKWWAESEITSERKFAQVIEMNLDRMIFASIPLHGNFWSSPMLLGLRMVHQLWLREAGIAEVSNWRLHGRKYESFHKEVSDIERRLRTMNRIRTILFVFALISMMISRDFEI
jgi:hypothetical protein